MNLPPETRHRRVRCATERPSSRANRGSTAIARRRKVLPCALAIVFAGCSLFGSSDPPQLNAATRPERIQALKQAIEADHVRLSTLISEPRQESSEGLHQDPEIETIARRLNANERELAGLERLEEYDAP